MSDNFIYPPGTTIEVEVPIEENELTLNSLNTRNHSSKKKTTFLEELFDHPESNIRFYNFVWLHLKFTEEAKFNKENLGHPEHTTQDISKFMRKLDERKERNISREIIKLFHKRTVHPEHLAWMKQSRAMKWIKGKLPQFDPQEIQRFPNAVGFIAIQSIFDYMDAGITAKIAHLNELKAQWDQNLKADRHLKWLDDKEHGKEYRELAWTVLCEKFPNRFNVVRPPSKYQDFLEIFDQFTEAVEGVSKENLAKSLKAKVSKLKNANKSKKAKNLDILLENHPRLKRLAERWGVPECVAMDRLISEAHEKEFGKE